MGNFFLRSFFTSRKPTNKKFPYLCFKFHRYPYFGSNVDVSSARFNNDETFIKFDRIFELSKYPFKDEALWDTHFPLKKAN